MITGTTRDLPAWMERLCHRFEDWRQRCDGRSRIPEALWASAVKAVGRYGLNPTARALRLDYYSLKKRVEAAGSCDGIDLRKVARSAGGQAHGKFIELTPVAAACTPECRLELEHPGGAKMRIHLTGMQSPDLTALSQSFWSMEI